MFFKITIIGTLCIYYKYIQQISFTYNYLYTLHNTHKYFILHFYHVGVHFQCQ